jgi:glycerol-3-phosphate dehydrogenase
MMTRSEMYRRFHAQAAPFDVVVVGGGATGVGVAVDAATRGYSVLLLEQHDFGKGTSSRSTKLVHGGVRYLEQGNLSLVMEALKERGMLAMNAPHLVRNLGFVVPNYEWWEAPFYGIGLKLYNLLAGKYGFGDSRILSQDETLRLLPNLQINGLRGGVIYFDGQFDDSRLLINLAATAFEQGATLLNYVRVSGVTKDADGFVNGVAKVTVGLAIVQAWFDKYIVDGLVNLVGGATKVSGRVLRFAQTGVLQNYTLVLFLGILVVAGVYIFRMW